MRVLWGEGAGGAHTHACVVGAWLGNVAEHVTRRDSGSCLSLELSLLPASCSRLCFLVFWNPKDPEPVSAGLCQGPIPDSSGWGRSDALARAEHCRAFPQPCLPSPPPCCSHLPAPLWPGQDEDFSLDAFPAGHFQSACLICICHPCCLEGLCFLVLLCNARGWSHK